MAKQPKTGELIGTALMRTVEAIKQGAGRSQVRSAEIYLGDIQRHCSGLMTEAPKLAVPVYVEDSPSNSDVVVLAKGRSGIFVVGAESSVLARHLSFGRTGVSPFDNGALSVAPTVLRWKADDMPAIRLQYADLEGAMVVGLKSVGESAASTARATLRDAIVEFFSRTRETPSG